MCHTAEIWFSYHICRSTKLPSYNNLMQLDVDIICWLWTHRLCSLMCDVAFCRWLAGWNTTALLLLLRTSYCWTTSFSSPSMEPTKVQSEGGLNVTLTIRLLMHGKVSEHSDWVSAILTVRKAEKWETCRGIYFFISRSFQWWIRCQFLHGLSS